MVVREWTTLRSQFGKEVKVVVADRCNGNLRVELALTGAECDYSAFYHNQAEKADQYWAYTNRPEYEADLWYNRLRNQISREMLTACVHGKVLSVGARGWIEEELLEMFDTSLVTRLDLVGDSPAVIAGDAMGLPFPAGAFDTVICRDVLEHVADADKAIEEAKRVLVQGGHYFVTTPNLLNVLPDGALHVRGWSPEAFLVDLRRHGFEIVATRGDIPNLLNGLLKLAQAGFSPIREFQEIYEQVGGNYYTGTFLYVLARKAG